jgi:hypothetical protein
MSFLRTENREINRYICGLVTVGGEGYKERL